MINAGWPIQAAVWLEWGSVGRAGACRSPTIRKALLVGASIVPELIKLESPASERLPIRTQMGRRRVYKALAGDASHGRRHKSQSRRDVEQAGVIVL